MQKQQVESRSISDMFTPALTASFKEEIDSALKSLNLHKVKAVLESYQIAHFQDSIDFLEALGQVLSKWKKEGQGSVVLGDVTTSNSRCMACEYGRKMTVYTFEYKHATAPTPMNMVHYSCDFGILLDIRNDIIYEIRVCNAFLNKYEMEDLSSI